MVLYPGLAYWLAFMIPVCNVLVVYADPDIIFEDDDLVVGVVIGWGEGGKGSVQLKLRLKFDVWELVVGDLKSIFELSFQREFGALDTMWEVLGSTVP